MTIRLLCAYGKFPTNAIVTLDAATEAGLVANKDASFNTAGGDVFFLDVVASAPVPAQAGGQPVTLKIGERTAITVPEGQTLNLTGGSLAVGVVQRVTAEGTILQSWPVGAGAAPPIGPYAGQQRFLVKCSSGSLAASVANAVLSVRPSKLEESNFLYEIPFSYLAVPVTVGENPYNELMQFTLPSDCDAAQVTLLNAANTAVSGVKVSVGYGSTLGAANGTLGLAASGLPIGGAFTKCTQNGNATGTLSAAGAVSTGPGAANIGGSDCGYGTFDLTICPTVPRADGNDRDKPVMYLNITWPPGSKRTFVELDGTTSVGWQNEGSQAARIAPFGHPRRVMVVANNPAANSDAQDNPALYLLSNNAAARSFTQFPAAIIAFSLRGGMGKTLVICADSIGANTGADIQYCGMAAELRALASTPSSPVAIANLSVAGSDITKWLMRVRSTSSIFVKANVLAPSGTVNSLGSPITQTSLNLVRRDFASIRKLWDRPGIFMLTSTVPPTGVTWRQYGFSDSLRIASNEYYMASGFPCLPLAEAIAGPLVTVPSGPQAGQTQQSIASKFTVDDLHPNSAGYREQAEKAYPVWMAL